MKKDIPQDLIIYGVLFLLITGGGAYGWMWVSGKVTETDNQLKGLEGQIRVVESQGTFPKKENLQQLEAQLTELNELISANVPKMELTTQALASVGYGKDKGLHPDEWKKLLFDKRKKLNELAKSSNVTLPEEFFYAMDRYQLGTPTGEMTQKLGYQLESIADVSERLIGSGIREIKSIKRVLVEDATGEGAGRVCFRLGNLNHWG